MHLRKLINQLGRSFRGPALVLGAWLGLLAAPLAAQKVVVLTAADIGKVVTGTYHFAERDASFKLTLKNRIGDQKAWQISLQKSQAFEKSPFTLKSELPATLPADGALEIEFGVSYSKSLQQENTISLLAIPTGETDALHKGIAVNIKLSADGVLMFFSDRTKQYSKSLPTMEFVGPGDKFLEVTWNGGSSRACTIKIEDSGRNAFSLVPNSAGGAPIASGSQVSLSNGGTSFMVKYDGAARKGSADLARITFTEPGGQSIVATMVGTYQGGNSLLAAAKDLLSKGTLIGGYNKVEPMVINKTDGVSPLASNVNSGNKTDNNAGSTPKKSTPEVKVNPDLVSNPPSEGVRVTQPTAVIKPTPSEKPTVDPLAEFDTGLPSADMAKERLHRYFRRFGEENLVKSPTVRFEKNEGVYQSHVRITRPDSLLKDQNFSLAFIRVKLKNPTDSVTINAGDNARMLSDTTLLLTLTNEDRSKLSSADSFQLTTEFYPSYESADGVVTNDSLSFKGVTYGKVISNNYWSYILWGSLIAAVLLFFGIGFLLAKQPINSFRYLRESRYQRERHNANSQRKRVDVETVYVDLARRDNDLIQLSFVDRGENLDGRAEGGIEKVRSIAATVPTPLRNGLRRFFSWLYAPFGRKREPKFKSVYYSLRIELPRGSVPQQLRLKDESGLLMLGTSLSGNVLATDHQDFKFVKRPFHYSIYLDPAEFLDYTGAMKTVSIPFRVIEEPFEGYVMTREFNLNLEIAQRY